MKWWHIGAEKTYSQLKRAWPSYALVLVVALLAYLLVQECTKIVRTPIHSWIQDVRGDCAVVLTGGVNRIREGLDLLAIKSIQKLVIAGVHSRSTLRDIFPLLPYYGSIDEKDIILEKRSTTTFGNAVQTLPLVEAIKCREVILITSQIHMGRAYHTFVANYPIQIPIRPRAVLAGPSESDWSEILLEGAKSLFYSAWAY